MILHTGVSLRPSFFLSSLSSLLFSRLANLSSRLCCFSSAGVILLRDCLTGFFFLLLALPLLFLDGLEGGSSSSVNSDSDAATEYSVSETSIALVVERPRWRSTARARCSAALFTGCRADDDGPAPLDDWPVSACMTTSRDCSIAAFIITSSSSMPATANSSPSISISLSCAVKMSSSSSESSYSEPLSSDSSTSANSKLLLDSSSSEASVGGLLFIPGLEEKIYKKIQIQYNVTLETNKYLPWEEAQKSQHRPSADVWWLSQAFRHQIEFRVYFWMSP